MRLKDKRAIVTGGTRGIGKAIVLELAANGCNVVFTFQSSEEAARKVEEEASKFGVKVSGLKADASILSEAEKTVSFALENMGGLDILVNNAGITKDNLLLRMTEDDFDRVIAANLKSVFNYTKVSVKPMMSQRYVIGFTKSAAKELASRNITVNAVAPGFISSDMTEKLNEKQKEAILNQVPLKKMGTGEDVAKTVVFLSSSDADYITGQVISVDGGMAM
jgi:3-oxoacyl-[acyl-carrier protein] reductase